MKKKTRTLDIFMKEMGMDYHCYTCDKNFRTAKALDRHIDRKHSGKAKRGHRRRNS